MEQTPTKEVTAVMQSYSLTLWEIAVISDLAQRLGINKSAALRRIIHEWAQSAVTK